MQSQNQQQPEFMYDGDFQASPVGVENKINDFTKWLLDDQNTIEELEHKLRGEVFNPDTERYIQRYSALVNETGISRIMSVVSSHLTKNFKTGILEEKYILNMIQGIRNDIIILFYLEAKNFKIEKSNLSIILDIIDNSIFVQIMSSKNGATLDWLKQSYSKNETHIQRIEPQQNGMFSFLRRQRQ